MCKRREGGKPSVESRACAKILKSSKTVTPKETQWVRRNLLKAEKVYRDKKMQGLVDNAEGFFLYFQHKEEENSHRTVEGRLKSGKSAYSESTLEAVAVVQEKGGNTLDLPPSSGSG